MNYLELRTSIQTILNVGLPSTDYKKKKKKIACLL